MTRINLLSKKVIAERKEKKWILLALLTVVAIGFCAFFLYTAKLAQIKSLERDIAQAEQEIAKYKELAMELEAIKKEKAVITRRLDAIKQLIEKDRQLWSHLLDEMSKSVPEGVWLKSMSDSGQDQLHISATALDNFAVARYMVNLMQNARFSEVELKDLHKSTLGNYEIRNFNLTCRYNREVAGT